MWALLPDVIVVIISEVVVDVIKHAFITKFNEIPADVSDEGDVSSSHQHECVSWCVRVNLYFDLTHLSR